MAKQPLSALFSIFGLTVWGDLADLSLYKNKKGRTVWFAKTWPHKPPSPEQIIQRALFTAAAAAWQTLAPESKKEWNTAARRASLCCHGYDLFVHWHLTADNRAIRTLENQTNTTLLPP